MKRYEIAVIQERCADSELPSLPNIPIVGSKTGRQSGKYAPRARESELIQADCRCAKRMDGPRNCTLGIGVLRNPPSPFWADRFLRLTGFW